jgi:hypothetical protein
MKISWYNIVKILFLLMLVVAYYILPEYSGGAYDSNMKSFARYVIGIYFFLHIGLIAPGKYGRHYITLYSAPEGEFSIYYIYMISAAIYLFWYIPTSVFFYVNIPVFIIYAAINKPYIVK